MVKLLSESEIEAIVAESLDSLKLDGQRVLVIIPDNTRTMPMPLFFRLLSKHLLGRARNLDYLIALGTHAPMSEAEILKHLGISAAEKASLYANVNIFNHEWQNDEALVTLDVIPASELEEISGGRLAVDVPVRLNRRVLDYDEILICGPVFPHEVAGFSGGNKYFFPGISGSEIINFTHWLGALITCYDTIGYRDTPIRKIMDRAASTIPRSRHAFCSVVTHEGLAGMFFGTPEEAFISAAALSQQVHMRYVEHPYRQVLSILPEMYDEIWVGAKGMYKLEPVVADSGELILYGPHIHEISRVHGHILELVGYHVRDYFVKQWDRFSHYPWGVLAHSTHVRGIGTYEDGVEKPRIQVTLATGIPEEVCQKINLGYCDPGSIRMEDWVNREEDGVLVVPRAGEILYRLKN
jgi:nickel-dependent lactate racemase